MWIDLAAESEDTEVRQKVERYKVRDGQGQIIGVYNNDRDAVQAASEIRYAVVIDTTTGNLIYGKRYATKMCGGGEIFDVYDDDYDAFQAINEIRGAAIFDLTTGNLVFVNQ